MGGLLQAEVELSSQFEICAPRPPAIVLGDGITPLQVLRLLRAAGIPAYAASATSDFARYSRHFRAVPGGWGLSPENLADSLYGLPFGKAVLIPCSDEWLLAVAGLPASVARDFPSSIPLRAVAETMVDKGRFAETLEHVNVPHPRTRNVGSLEELAEVPASEFSDSILKPLNSLSFSRRYRRKGFRLQNRGQALAIMQDKPFPILLQEFIPGPPTVSYFLEGFVDQHGTVCGMLARHRLRMFPPDLGNSSLSESIPLAAMHPADQALRRLLDSVSYRGIFDAEFKYDQRDGQFKMLEINARPWWYIEFTAHCGLDVCTMAYQDALNIPVEPVTNYEVGRRSVHLVNDFRAWWKQRRQGKSLRSWIRLWSRAEETLLHLDDPVMGLAFFATAFQRRRGETARARAEHSRSFE